MMRKAMESGVINNHEPLNFDFLDKNIMAIKPKTNDIENEWWTMYCEPLANNVICCYPIFDPYFYKFSKIK